MSSIDEGVYGELLFKRPQAADIDHGNVISSGIDRTVQDKPAFRNAWRKGRRCLIPANGYYEWKTGGERKQPCHIQMPGRALFAFGGLWDRCHTNDGETIESCTIITTAPAAGVRPIHHRMPLIISVRAYDDWLQGADPASMIRPFDGDVELYPVSTFVNNPRNDDPRCIDPL